MGLPEISNVLWRERQLLELLLFKLEEEQLILNSDRPRWLGHATREVETVLSEIKRLELERAIELQATATAMGLSGTPSLAELAHNESGPWARIFAEHKEALTRLAREIDDLSAANRALVERSQAAAHETLAVFEPSGLDTQVL
jgi:hypothetical protein